MRYSQLIEDLQTTTTGIKNILQSILISLMSSGVFQIPMQSLIDEIRDKTSQDIPIDTLTQLLQSSQVVQSVDAENVQLHNPNESQEESSSDKVEQMANNADYSQVTSPDA